MSRSLQLSFFFLILTGAPRLQAEDILVASRFTNNILRYDAVSGAFKGIFASGNGLANPNGLAIGPDRRLYVALGDSPVVLRFDAVTGAFIDRFIFDDPATTEDETGGLASPRDITFGPEGDLYVASGGSDRIIRYDGRSGRVVRTAAIGDTLRGPVGVAVAPDGTVIAGGALSNAIYVFREGMFIRRCASPSLHGTITGLLMAPDGRVYASTGQRNTILLVNIETCATEVFASSTEVNIGIYMNYDASGSVLLGSFLNNTVVRFDRAGRSLGPVFPSGAGGLNGTHDIVVAPDPLPPMSARWIIPGVARAAGAGSFFRTTVWLTNPHDQPITLRLRFHPGTGFTQAGASDPGVLTLAPGAMRTYADVLSETFRVSADTAGTIVVETAEGSPLPLVTARTFNDAAIGTFGQYIEAVSVQGGAEGQRWIHGLGAGAFARTNVGLVNRGETESVVTLSMWSPAGQQLGSDLSVTVPPRTSTQINGIQNVLGAGPQQSFSVRMTGSADVFLYASKLDNTTSDPIFVVPLPVRTRQWIDGIGSVPGANRTFFRSSLTLANTSTTPASVRIAYTRRGEAAPSRTVEVSLPAGQSRQYEDLISELLSLDSTAGTIRIDSGAVPIVAWARTYNDPEAPGTFGQFIPSFGDENLIGERGVILQGLGQNERVRTNAGLVNVGASVVDAMVAAYDSAGTLLATKTYRVEGGQSIFVGSILSDLGATSSADLYLRVNASRPGSIYAWASFVDNRSTDPTFVRPLVP